jgi:acyl-CoA thioesterase-1
VRKILASRANVHRAPENCGPTANSLKKLETWLASAGPGKWDIIYFNFGIHDRATPIADYTARLTQIIVRLKQTGATVIWASTTPIPDDPSKNQTAASIIERNAAAAALAKQHALRIDDLFTFITPHLSATQRPNDVHFTDRGYKLLATQVAATLSVALPTK